MKIADTASVHREDELEEWGDGDGNGMRVIRIQVDGKIELVPSIVASAPSAILAGELRA
jgi:hypothetical protein